MAHKRMGYSADDLHQGTSQKRHRIRISDPGDNASVLHPSPHQMRLLWDHDVRCGYKYMGAPMRRCSSIEKPDEPGVCALSDETMTLMMSEIRNMWKRLSLILEIFEVKEEPTLGHRLRVKENLPIKVSMKPCDQVLIGWKVIIPPDCESRHLYDRSRLKESDLYLGGPLSFCNWSSSASSTLIVREISHGSRRHQVRAETKGVLLAGTELLWDYGEKKRPDFSKVNWINPLCCTSDHQIAKPLSKKKSKDEVFPELCVLCGAPYRLNSNKSVDRKAQKKVHFLNSHVDFLGSDWTGYGTFDKNVYEINYDQALLEAERLNRLLQRLHSNAWKVVPACTVMTIKEQAEDTDAVMNTFRKHCARLMRVGCIVLRGRVVPTTVEDLLPVSPCRWDKLFSEEEKPKRIYAMKEPDRLASEAKLKDWCSQDVMMVMNTYHENGDSSSEDDE
ncbi:uncharacterized protein LOC117639736 [Thrips palmi]|uniref:Uncharacterized protein LOC117639736 n=1 Tax=Thrips palmi TaxID=161013 RepID=A0A6P8YCK1_THRPL|nr:uncharacterized protein LOC117639736 [Thrips palmi]